MIVPRGLGPGVANILAGNWKVMVGFGPLLAGKSGTSNAGRTTGGHGVEELPGGEPPQRVGGQPLGSRAQSRRAEGEERP